MTDAVAPGVRTALDLLGFLNVVEIGDSVSSAAAGAFLRGLGARVVKVRHGPALIERFRPGGPMGSASYLSRFLDEGKTVRDWEDSDGLGELLGRADVVLCDVEGELPPALAFETLTGYLRVVEALNRRAWLSISPFGLSGPHRDYRGSDLIHLASGGVLASVRSPDDGRPIKFAGHRGSILTGEVGGLAALHAYDIARREQRPVHFEVSAQEAALSTGPCLQCTNALLDCPPHRYGNRPGIGVFGCRDGHVLLLVMEDRHWAGLVAAMGRPAWTAGIVTFDDRLAHADEIRAQIERWAATLGKEECAALLQSHGVPISPVNGPAEVLESPQFAARGFLRDRGTDGLRGSPG